MNQNITNPDLHEPDYHYHGEGYDSTPTHNDFDLDVYVKFPKFVVEAHVECEK